MKNYIAVNWNTPIQGISAYISTRLNGHSLAPYTGLNLGTHVGDNLQHVENNRIQLANELKLPSNPLWLNQTHSNIAINSDDYYPSIEADAIYTNRKNTVIPILTADCLPVLMASKDGSEIAALHLGWRSLTNNLIANTLKYFKCDAGDIQAYLGPCISQTHYEVGTSVFDPVMDICPKTQALKATSHKKWHLNLPQLAAELLNEANINNIKFSHLCTFSDEKHFYSYRRNKTTGRLASLIWIN